MYGRKLLLQRIEVFRIANTCYNVFSLSINEKVSVRLGISCCSIAGEADSGSGIIVSVAKHHGLNIDCRT